MPQRLGDAVHGGQGEPPEPPAAGATRTVPAGRRNGGAEDQEGFGTCTNHGACERACPKEIRIDFIARLNGDVLRAAFRGTDAPRSSTTRDGQPGGE